MAKQSFLNFLLLPEINEEKLFANSFVTVHLGSRPVLFKIMFNCFLHRTKRFYLLYHFKNIVVVTTRDSQEYGVLLELHRLSKSFTIYS